jgi:U3 small nucleolar ribonucleoprotein protein LCP5
VFRFVINCFYCNYRLINGDESFLGQRIEKDPAIDRLVEIRTILEKIRPIDYKLRYQIDKLVKTAVTGSTNASDPLNFKANPSNLMSQLNNDSEDESSSDDEDDAPNARSKKKSKNDELTEEVGKYVPPKLTSMPYEDETAAEKKEKLQERARRRQVNSTLIDEWKEEFLDTPVEISGGSRAQQMISKAMKERERYEEDNMTRLPVTKADKHRNSRLSTMGTLGAELTGFGGNSGSGKKRKGAGGKKGGKKRKFH